MMKPGRTPPVSLDTRLTLAALGVAAFGVLLAAVVGDTVVVQWDAATADWVHAHVPSTGLRLFQALSLLGSPAPWVIGVAAVLRLARRGDYALAGSWIAALGGGGLLQEGLKAVIGRARPPYAGTFLHDHSSSYPSGHAMASILCYGMLAWTLTVLWEPARRHRRLLWLGAVLVMALVGVSRVGLGVHFPSDVVGGFLAGGAWLVLWITIAEALRSPRERIAADARTGDRGAV
jgi:membrane-associated phospholipid phosphatase